MTRTVPAPRATSARPVGVAAVVLAALAAVLLLAAPASAHAMLVEASPADRSTHDEAPEVASLTFNEPITAPTGGVRVFDGSANRVDTGPADVGGPETVAVGLPDDLPDGGYILTYRVVSADSHPIGGALTFTIGDADEIDDALVAEVFGGGDGASGILGTALRGLGYVATLLAVGAVAFSLLVARRDEDRASARRIGIPAALAGIVLVVLALPVQAAGVTGGSLLDGFAPTALGEVLTSSFGLSALVRVGGLLLVALLWRLTGSLPAVGGAGLVALGSYLLDGHQRTVEPTWLLMTGDAVHLVAAAVWFGGLVLLAVALRRRRLGADPVAAATLVARFSAVAFVSVIAVTIGGVAMSVPLVGAPATLLSTSYGLTLVVKVALVAVVVLLAAYNRQRLVPAIAARVLPAGGAVDAAPSVAAATARSDRAWRRLTTTVRVEAAIVLVVVLVTGALVTQRPAAEEAGLTGLFQQTVSLSDDLDLDFVVDPNQAGLNTVHAYVLDATGRPSADASDLTFELTFLPEDIGPFVIEPYLAGPGHWVATIEDIAFPGEWEARVVVGTDRFSESVATVRFTVSN